MQESELRILIIVLVVGTLIAAIGATLVFLILRSFGRGKPPFALIAIALAFIFVCCVGFFLWATRV